MRGVLVWVLGLVFFMWCGFGIAGEVDYIQEPSLALISQDGGAAGTRLSYGHDVSADGRYVVFASYAGNLVDDDLNENMDVFLKDTQTGAVSLVSEDATGTRADGRSWDPCVSDDGRYAAFVSTATNLVANTHAGPDVFRKDMQTGEIVLVSKTTLLEAGNGDSYHPYMSADGRRIVFASEATNLASGASSSKPKVFYHDAQLTRTDYIPPLSTLPAADQFGLHPVISNDGLYVAFDNYKEFQDADFVGPAQVFYHDRATGVTAIASMNLNEETGNGHSRHPSISTDGRYVSFISSASNLDFFDYNYATDAYLYDDDDKFAHRISNKDGETEPGDGNATAVSISSDGSGFVLASLAEDMVSGNPPNHSDLYLFLDGYGFTGLTDDMGKTADSTLGKHSPVFSGAGVKTVFATDMALDPADTNETTDVYGLSPLSPCEMSLSPTSRLHLREPGSGSFNLTIGQGCSWSVGDVSVDWLDVTTASAGNGNFKVEYDFERNNTPTVRSGTITMLDATGREYVYKVFQTISTATELPAKVGSVTATDGTYANKVVIDWTQATGASYFRIYRLNADGRENTFKLIGESSYITFDDTDVTPGTTYTYMVRAVNSQGEGTDGDIDTGYAEIDMPDVPGIPTNVTASDATFSDRIRISWDPVDSAASYKVYKAQGAGDNPLYELAAEVADTSYDDKDTYLGYLFRFRVSAVNMAGESKMSVADDGRLSPHLAPAAAAPLNVSATDGEHRDKVTVSWTTSENASSYTVHRAPSGTEGLWEKLGTTTGTSYDDTTAEITVRYDYRVQAVNEGSTSDMSAPDEGYRGGKTPGPAPTDSTYDGWWYIPSESGTGLSIGVENNVLFLAWYIYDTSGEPVWYVAWCEKGTGEIFNGDLRSFSGWELGTPWTAASTQVKGSVTLTFTDTMHMTFQWILDGTPGSKSYEKYMPSFAPGHADSRGITGWYSDPAYPGMGCFLEARGETLFMGFYHYAENGKPRWWVLGGWDHVGEFQDGDTTYTGTFMEFEADGGYGHPWTGIVQTALSDSATLNFTPTGSSFTLNWNDQATFTMQPYTIEMPDFGSGGNGGTGGTGHITYRQDLSVYKIEAKQGATPFNVSAELDKLAGGTLDHWLNITPDGKHMLIETDRFDPACAGWPCLAVLDSDATTAETIRTGSKVVHTQGFSALASGAKKVIFPDSDGTHDMDLFVSTKSGVNWSEPAEITTSSTFAWNYMPAVSADGTKVLFNCGPEPYGDGTSICEVKTDGTGFRVVLTPDSPPSGLTPGGAVRIADYSPNGGIVFEGEWEDAEELYGLPTATSKNPIPLGNYNNDNSPCVLPDGSIASLWLDRPGSSGQHELKVLSSDASSHFMLVTGQDILDTGLGCGE